MRSVYVNLPTTQSVQDFVNTLAELPDDFELISGNYILDARSLLGILALDRTKPVELKIYADSEENLNAIERFLVPQKELLTDSERKDKR